ncbi:MAG: hypothetical protein JW863_19560 [Chitinispirillaceae bacterium]|nr:hypothetical protein [Chitinispirillaceae bacterium]
MAGKIGVTVKEISLYARPLPENQITYQLSLLSWPVYHFIHAEPVDFKRNPLDNEMAKEGALPIDANQAVATLLFERDYRRFHERFPFFEKVVHHRSSFFAYPLSGGFNFPSPVPLAAVRLISILEKKIHFLDRYLAFRILVALEKKR